MESGKADPVTDEGRQQFSGALRQVLETPPGSESRACDERVARELGRAGCFLACKPELRSAG